MNGRVFGKRFVAVVLLIFGFVSFAGEGETGMKVVLMVLCAICAIILWPKTPADDAWERRCAARTPKSDEKLERVDGGKVSGQSRTGVWVIGATILHVLAAPVLILRDLLKLQK